ncbi:hypothetical protein [Skermanella pratensis]|uniref:hypothetical protein n=1 Tax=Skermanella pratensis TaxID=2233999 RepID=UPI001787B979|nr:hypothetical protein [Skermanella pratensis]
MHISDLKSLQNERAFYNLTTFLAGVVAATGLVYGAHIDLIAGAGIVAGSAQVLNSTGSPAQKQALLLRANRRLGCASDKVETAQGSIDARVPDPVAAELLRDAVSAIENNLITSWIDSTATLDFKTVLNNISATAGIAKAGPEAAAGGPSEEERRKALATALAACAIE